MEKINNKKIITTSLLALLFFNSISSAYALVGGSTINTMSGVDSVTHNAATQTTNITTNNAVNNSTINWQTLNVGKTETLDVNFTRGSQTLLNNVVSGMTTVAGQILSTGVGADSSRIIISNPNGILLDKGSYINANALILTTLGVDLNGTSAILSPKNGSIAAPNTGIVIKGKIDSNNLGVASRGIVLDGADIFANGDVSLVTAEGATFQLGTAIPTNIIAIDRGLVSTAANTVKYADRVTRTDNIILKSNTAIKSKDGKIYLSDQRMNAGGINIAASTITAKNGIAIDSTNYTKIATLKSDADTTLNIKNVANPYANQGLVSISGIDAIKGVKIESELNNGQSVTLTSVKAKDGGINVDGFKKVTISTSESTGNVAVKGATDIYVTSLTNEAQTDLTSSNSTTIKTSFLRSLFSDTNKLAVSGTQLDQVNLKAAAPTSTIAISTLSGYADKNNTVSLDTTGTFTSASVAANTGHSLNVGNINTTGNISLSGKDVSHKAGSTLKSTNGTIAMTAANNLTTSNIDSFGTITLKGKDITSNNGSTIKSKNGSLSITATNNLDTTGADLISTNGTATLKATNTLKTSNIDSYGYISLTGKDIIHTAGSTLKSANGTVAMTATNNLTTSNIDSYGTITLKGKDITSNNGSTIKSKNGSLSITATNNLDTTGADLISTNGTATLKATNTLKTSNVTSYGNISLTGKDVSNSTKSSLTSENGSITATATNFLQVFNLKAAQNMALKGTNLLIVTNASTPKAITLTSNYKSNIHQNNVTSAKTTLYEIKGTPASSETQIEADRLAKIEADRPAAEKAEADRLAKIEADRLAKIEADRIAEEARLAKIEADRLAKIEADRIAEEARLAKIEADRLAKIAKDEKEKKDKLAKNEVDKTAESKGNDGQTNLVQQSTPSLASQLAQNVKSLAADETTPSVTEERLIQKTATGFYITKKIAR